MTEEVSFHSPKDYLDLARYSDATPEQLRSLSTSEYGFVREAVAGHRATPADVLASLVPVEVHSWNDISLLITLIRNAHTPVDALNSVPELVLPGVAAGGHKEFEAGVALAERHDVPDAILRTLVSDARATTEFRKVIARQTTSEPLREVLLSDRSERVRRAAARARPSAD